MAVVRTKLAPGQVAARDGSPEHLTPQRFQRWADKFHALQADGIKFGVPWGHFEECDPGAIDFFSSRLNAGYLEDLSVDTDGALNIVLDCPGLEQGENGTLIGKAELADGTKVQTAIKEVSPGVWQRWRDGKGNLHTDLVGHVALTMMPIVAGQSGFQPLSTDRSGITYFSTSVKNMADDKKDDADSLKKDVEAVSKDDDADGESDAILKPAEDTSNSEAEKINQVVALFAQGGCPLPPDTTPENFVDRLLVAATVMVAAQTAQKNAQADEEKKADQKPIVEENGPAPGVMLSTERLKSDPVMRAMTNRLEKQMRATREEDIEHLKRCGLTVADANELAAKPLFLSTKISPTGDIVDDENDRIIAYLKRAFKNSGFEQTFLSTATHANVRAIDSPMEGDEKPTGRAGTVPVTASQAKIIESMGGKVVHGSKS